MNEAEITEDTLSDGALTLRQHANGFRFGLDAVLLATDLPELPDEPEIADLGAGQGAVGLCIANRHADATVLAVERQKSLADLLRENIRLNNLSDRVEALRADVRELSNRVDPHSFDLAVCNPPYHRQGERRPSPNTERADACHEHHGDLADFIAAACYILDQRGYLKIILPPRRLDDLFRAIDSTDLGFYQLRLCHSRSNDNAYLAECRLRRGGARELKVVPPLYIYKNQSDYTKEVQTRIEKAAAPEK